jgi:hypothetical protein
MAEKVIGETMGYYTQSGINPKPGQRVIDVIKEYGEFIPLMKGKMISASQLLERFLLMLKTIRFCGSFKRWGIETFVPVYRFNSESNS